LCHERRLTLLSNKDENRNRCPDIMMHPYKKKGGEGGIKKLRNHYIPAPLFSAEPAGDAALGLGGFILNLFVKSIDLLQGFGLGILGICLNVALGRGELLVGLGNSRVELCASLIKLRTNLSALVLGVGGAAAGKVRLDLGGSLVNVALKLGLGGLRVTASTVEVVADTTGGSEAEVEGSLGLGHVDCFDGSVEICDELFLG